MNVPLLLLDQPLCTDCKRCNAVESVGIGSRRADNQPKTRNSCALLMVGEQPGFNEDRQNQCFIGKSGQILQNAYIDAAGLADLATVYLGNAIRCGTGKKPTKGELTACHRHLERDVQVIAENHDALTILCLGTYAAQSILGIKLTAALRRQGAAVTWMCGVDTPVYSTYHPAYLMAGRNPSARRAVVDHLRLLIRHLEGGPKETALAQTTWTKPGEDHPNPFEGDTP